MRVGWVSAIPDRRIASFRFRVEAPAAGLRARGHDVELFDPEAADRYDVLVFSKAYAARHQALARTVKRRGRRVVVDLCDNHFYNPYDLPKYRQARDDLAAMLSIADRVICSTRALAAAVAEETDHAVAPIVVTDIVDRIKLPKRVRRNDEPLKLTWFGSHGSPNAPSGMTDLLLIREELEYLATRQPVELTVCSNNREKFEQSIASFRMPTRYVEWSLEDFPAVLAESDTAVLPMDINPFTACKTHNRLTTALYAGIPVVAAGIDSYRELSAFCTLDDWRGGLQALAESRPDERARALSSRDHIDQRWTMDSMAVQWETALALEAAPAFRERRLSKARLQGRLDAVARGAVTGWVRALLDPSLRLHVVLECDGEPIAIGAADRKREDLSELGTGATECGFSLALPPSLSGKAPRLTVRVLDTDWVVGENPIVIDEGERASFAPALSAADLPGSAREAQKEQRWDIAESVAVQERALADLQRRQAGIARSRRLAAKEVLTEAAAESGFSDPLEAEEKRPGLKKLLRETSIIAARGG